MCSVATGFRRVGPKEYKPRLLQFNDEVGSIIIYWYVKFSIQLLQVILDSLTHWLYAILYYTILFQAQAAQALHQITGSWPLFMSGIVLWRFDLYEFVWECNGFVLKGKNLNVLWIKLTYSTLLLCGIYFVLCGTQKTITCQNHFKSVWEAGKQQRIQHSNRVSQFYSQNIQMFTF